MLYSFARFVLILYVKILYRLEVTGCENIPESGPLLICSNHIGYTDPVSIAVSCKRKINFIAKKEVFKNKIIAFFARKLKAFPVDRGTADMSAYKTAVNLLKKGEVVGIFAQGTRVKEIDAKNAKAGVALFALKSDAKILPVCITSSYKFFTKIKVSYGEIISLEEYKNKKINTKMLNEITEGIMESISSLSV